MTNSLLPLVKQGDPAAIAALLNRSLYNHRVRVKVQYQSDRFHVLLEAKPLPEALTALGFICKGFQLLKIESIHPVTIYGCQVGDRLPTWQHTISIQSSAIPSRLIQPSQFSSEPDATADNAADNAVDDGADDAADNAVDDGADAADDEPTAPLHLVPSIHCPSDIPDLLKRPESVVMLLFFSLMLFWNAYLTLLEEVESSEDVAPQAVHLSSGQLARRLKTSRRCVRDMKHRDIFSEWTRKLDPEGTAWAYRRGVYIPEPVRQ